MKLLVIASKFPPEYSGPGVRIPKLYHAIGDNIGLKEKYVLCNGIEQTRNENYTHEGFEVTRRTISWARKVPVIGQTLTHFLETLQAAAYLRSHPDIDLLHIFGNSGATTAGLAFAKARNIPVIMELVNAEATPFQRLNLFQKIAPHKNSVVIALSENAKSKAVSLGFPKDKIWCRPNPINTEIFHPNFEKKLKLREMLSPFHENDILISSVAKFMPRKNQVFLIEVLSHLPEHYKLLIAGPLIENGPLHERDKKYVKTIQNRVSQNKLEDRTHIVNDFVNAPDYMHAADIYALPAWDEGFGTPMVEALACGLPVIANKNEAAFQEWVRNGKNGYLCDIQNPKEWAQKIEELLHIDQSTKLKNSDYIQELAGEKNIYKGYVKHIKTLMNNK